MKLEIPTNYQQALRLPPTDWTLYHLEAKPSDSFLWQRFKLMLPPGTVSRHGWLRAFRLAWNPLEMRLALDGPARALLAQDAELYARVVLLLEFTFDREWLEDRYDRGEIDAERERLKAIKAQARAGRRAARQAL